MLLHLLPMLYLNASSVNNLTLDKLLLRAGNDCAFSETNNLKCVYNKNNAWITINEITHPKVGPATFCLNGHIFVISVDF